MRLKGIWIKSIGNENSPQMMDDARMFWFGEVAVDGVVNSAADSAAEVMKWRPAWWRDPIQIAPDPEPRNRSRDCGTGESIPKAGTLGMGGGERGVMFSEVAFAYNCMQMYAIP